MPTACDSPAATVANPSPTRTGLGRTLAVPSPSIPHLFPPQASSVPSGFTARTWQLPALAEAKPVPTRTGLVAVAGVAAPIWPQ